MGFALCYYNVDLLEEAEKKLGVVSTDIGANFDVLHPSTAYLKNLNLSYQVTSSVV